MGRAHPATCRKCGDSTFVITNNHFEGKGVVNALQLIHLLTQAKVKVPETASPGLSGAGRHRLGAPGGTPVVSHSLSSVLEVNPGPAQFASRRGMRSRLNRTG